jgi:putative hemolysin
MIYTVSRKTILWISILTLILWFTFAKTDNTACTMEYAPVCGQFQMLCSHMPCPPDQKTFGNRCQMNAEWYDFLYDWECKTSAPDLSDCETYFDWCNNCSISDWKLMACTLMYCETPQEPKCIKYKSIWMANPASVYCERNWWTLEIKSDDKWQYGVCNFTDWSSCEERAYYRWECKKISPIEKYLSWYISKNYNQFPDIASKITFLQNLKNKFAKTYRNISSSIQGFIEMLYSNDYEKKKFTLDADWDLLSFSLHIPKSRKNKYSEHIVLNKKWSTLIFKYNQSKQLPNMIFSITIIQTAERENLVKQWLLNTNKIAEYGWYVFYYSQALDMPYAWKYAEEYWDMISSINNIIQTFKIIK